MFYIVLLMHILIYIETIYLYKKKLRKKSSLLFLTNTLMTIINIIKLYKLSKLQYSIILELKDQIIQNPMQNIFWILIQLSFIGYTIYTLKYASKKKKQNKMLKYGIYILCTYMSLILAIILLNKSINIFLLLVSIIIIIKETNKFIKTKKNYILTFLLLFSLMTFYHYGTYEGQARFQILLMGYPKEAYETGLEELKYYEEKNSKKYAPVKNILLKEKRIEMIEVKNYGIIKISRNI